MAKLRTLFVATVTVAVSTVTVQAADLELAPRFAARAWHYHHRWRHRRAPVLGGLVAGVRGATPLTVPFYAYGWYPGPAYYYGWRRHICCAAAEPVISVNY